MPVIPGLLATLIEFKFRLEFDETGIDISIRHIYTDKFCGTVFLLALGSLFSARNLH
jgi:hypothetical protein